MINIRILSVQFLSSVTLDFLTVQRILGSISIHSPYISHIGLSYELFHWVTTCLWIKFHLTRKLNLVIAFNFLVANILTHVPIQPTLLTNLLPSFTHRTVIDFFQFVMLFLLPFWAQTWIHIVLVTWSYLGHRNSYDSLCSIFSH